MILVDANLLIYAASPQSDEHEASREWLEKVMAGPGLVRFAWLSLWAFLRITTNPRVFERPLMLATIAIEHGAVLHTTDRNFARFDGLRWTDPLSAESP